MQPIVFNQQNIKRKWLCAYILFGAIIVQCLIITMFSSQVAAVSKETSNTVVEIVKRIIGAIPVKNMEKTEYGITYIIRKMAHFYNFALLGALLLMNKKVVKGNGNKSLMWAGVGLFVAVFDEVHQYFVPGRSAEIYDVMIDFSGVLFGISITHIVLWLILSWRQNERRSGCFK